MSVDSVVVAFTNKCIFYGPLLHAEVGNTFENLFKDCLYSVL